MIGAIRKTARALDAFAEGVGALASHLVLGMTVVTFAVVALGFFFRLGWVWLQESITYMHGMLFMAAAAYTFRRDEHVRIDVFYAKLGARGKAWVNLCGTIFLLFPTLGFLFWACFPFVADSWRVWEGSYESGGIPASFALKSFILFFVFSVALQGVSLALSSLATLLAAPDDGDKSGES